jgi:spore maturation protein SpmA
VSSGLNKMKALHLRMPILVKACPTSSSFVPSRIVMIRCSKSGSNGLEVFASVMFAEMSSSSSSSIGIQYCRRRRRRCRCSNGLRRGMSSGYLFVVVSELRQGTSSG